MTEKVPTLKSIASELRIPTSRNANSVELRTLIMQSESWEKHYWNTHHKGLIPPAMLLFEESHSGHGSGGSRGVVMKDSAPLSASPHNTRIEDQDEGPLRLSSELRLHCDTFGWVWPITLLYHVHCTSQTHPHPGRTCRALIVHLSRLANALRTYGYARCIRGRLYSCARLLIF